MTGRIQNGKTIPLGEDIYSKVREGEEQAEFLDIQEEYIKDEMKNLKREMVRAREEIKRICAVPLMLGQFLEMVDEHYGACHGFSFSKPCIDVHHRYTLSLFLLQVLYSLLLALRIMCVFVQHWTGSS
jgi:ATP-dependent 26S proteasome regulatory subunit